MIVPDATGNAQPTCIPGRTIVTNSAIEIRVKTMAYTPCAIVIGNGGVWTGAMYSGTLDDGGDISIYTTQMALPGQWGTGPGGSGGGGAAPGAGKTLGALISQRDVP
jgi:hypothetical protein